VQIEIRNDSVIISGYVNAIERDSRIMHSPHGRFVEQVKAKTFQRALESTDNVNLLMNHNSNMMLGSTMEGNLKLAEDTIGLRAMATITDAETIQKAKDNKLVGWSFGFSVMQNGDHWEDYKDGIQRRYLENIRLLEVSILDNTRTPAYIGTSIESRDGENTLLEHRTVEDTPELIDNSKEEKREDKQINYSIIENEIALLKLKA
jgi:HK97 family phage prohead protease